VAGTFLFLLGWLVFRENQRQFVSRIFSVLLFLGAAGPVFAAFSLLLKSAPSGFADAKAFETIALCWDFFFPQLFLFSLVFPVRSKILKSFPRLYTLFYLPPAFHLLIALFLTTGDDIRTIVDTASLFEGHSVLLEPIRLLLAWGLKAGGFLVDYREQYFALVNILFIAATITVMNVNYNNTISVQLRKQVRLILWGIRVSTGLYAVGFLIPTLFLLDINEWQSYALLTIGVVLGTGAIAWAIIKHQFLNIQFIIRRGFIVSAASGMLVGLYLLIYSETKHLATQALGENAKFIEAFFLMIAVIAFQPLLNLLEYLVDQILSKRLGNYREDLQKLNKDVLTFLDQKRLREKVVNSLTESMLIEVVHLFISTKQGIVSPVMAKEKRSIVFALDGDIVRGLAGEGNLIFLNDLQQQCGDSDEFIALKRIRSKVIFPLHHRDKLQGMLVVGQKITTSNYSLEELGLLSLLADHIALSLENMQLYQEMLRKESIEKELSVSREIQRLLLPEVPPKCDWYEISALNIASQEIGGDYYDFIQREGKLGIAIGDVAGKGIPGAILMSNLQAVFRAHAMQNDSPGAVVQHVNNHIVASSSAEKFVTFFYGMLDPDSLILTFTNAGHNFPMLYRENKVEFIKGADLIIGVRADFEYTETRLQLKRGDVVLFYTDGLSETHNEAGTFFGEEGLKEFILANGELSLDSLRDLLYSHVTQFSNTRSLSDDVTIVLLRIL